MMWVNKQLKIKLKTKSFSDNYQKAVQGARTDVCWVS